MWHHLKTVITFRCSDTFMAHELYSNFPIQNTFMSTVVLVNEVREVLQRHSPLSAILLTSLSILHNCQLQDQIFFSTKALLAFWVIPNWFSKFCRQNGYLNSKLMLRWDSHFKHGHCHVYPPPPTQKRRKIASQFSYMKNFGVSASGVYRIKWMAAAKALKRAAARWWVAAAANQGWYIVQVGIHMVAPNV